MSHKSPSKVLRNVKRITKFLAKKAAEKKPLTLQKLPEIDIPPRIKILTLSQETNVSILPSPPRVLSFSKPVLTDIPPETPKQCIPYPPTTKRIFPSNHHITKLQTIPNIPAHPAPALGRRIPQLDGVVDQENVECSNCMKVLETQDDVKWHYETKIGREDCSILRSMLGWHPD